jgi:hypothetical protein
MSVNQREWEGTPHVTLGDMVLARVRASLDPMKGRLDSVDLYNGHRCWTAELALSSEEEREATAADLAEQLGCDPSGARILLDLLLKQVEKAAANAPDPVQAFASRTTLAQVEKEVIPPMCIIKGLLVSGLTLLVGGPKLGKSIILLDLGLRIAGGRPVFGRLHATQAEVLYLILEDGEARTTERIKQMLDGEPAPDTMYLVYEAEPLGPRLVTQLDMFIDDHQGCKVVFVDTLARTKAGMQEKRGESFFQIDYEQALILHAWAQRRGVCLVVACHARKAAAVDVVSMTAGTNGLPAASDNVLTLQRARGESRATLTATGRDVEERTLQLAFDARTRCYTLLEGEELATANEEAMNPTRQAIIAALRGASRPLSPTDLERSTTIPSNTIKARLRDMVQAGQVLKAAYGSYTLNTLVVTEPTDSPDPEGDEDDDEEE